MVGLLCHWGFMWGGNILVWDLQMTWVNLGAKDQFLLSSCTDKMIPASQRKLFHSPSMPGNFARESCPSLNIGERGQNLNLVPYHLEGWRSDFHPDWLCPAMLYFIGYAKTYFYLLPVATQDFMPCAVTPLPRARSRLCTVLELGTGPQRSPACKRALTESAVTLAIALRCNPSYVTASVTGTLKASCSVSEACLRSVCWSNLFIRGLDTLEQLYAWYKALFDLDIFSLFFGHLFTIKSETLTAFGFEKLKIMFSAEPNYLTVV